MNADNSLVNSRVLLTTGTVISGLLLLALTPDALRRWSEAQRGADDEATKVRFSEFYPPSEPAQSPFASASPVQQPAPETSVTSAVAQSNTTTPSISQDVNDPAREISVPVNVTVHDPETASQFAELNKRLDELATKLDTKPSEANSAARVFEYAVEGASKETQSTDMAQASDEVTASEQLSGLVPGPLQSVSAEPQSETAETSKHPAESHIPVATASRSALQSEQSSGDPGRNSAQPADRQPANITFFPFHVNMELNVAPPTASHDAVMIVESAMQPTPAPSELHSAFTQQQTANSSETVQSQPPVMSLPSRASMSVDSHLRASQNPTTVSHPKPAVSKVEPRSTDTSRTSATLRQASPPPEKSSQSDDDIPVIDFMERPATIPDEPPKPQPLRVSVEPKPAAVLQPEHSVTQKPEVPITDETTLTAPVAADESSWFEPEFPTASVTSDSSEASTESASDTFMEFQAVVDSDVPEVTPVPAPQPSEILAEPTVEEPSFAELALSEPDASATDVESSTTLETLETVVPDKPLSPTTAKSSIDPSPFQPEAIATAPTPVPQVPDPALLVKETKMPVAVPEVAIVTEAPMPVPDPNFAAGASAVRSDLISTAVESEFVAEPDFPIPPVLIPSDASSSTPVVADSSVANRQPKTVFIEPAQVFSSEPDGTASTTTSTITDPFLFENPADAPAPGKASRLSRMKEALSEAGEGLEEALERVPRPKIRPASWLDVFRRKKSPSEGDSSERSTAQNVQTPSPVPESPIFASRPERAVSHPRQRDLHQSQHETGKASQAYFRGEASGPVKPFQMPRLPELDIPPMPQLATMPSMPGMPDMPRLPSMPKAPPVSQMLTLTQPGHPNGRPTVMSNSVAAPRVMNFGPAPRFAAPSWPVQPAMAPAPGSDTLHRVTSSIRFAGRPRTVH